MRRPAVRGAKGRRGDGAGWFLDRDNMSLFEEPAEVVAELDVVRGRF
jgi:hypothetical protein